MAEFTPRLNSLGMVGNPYWYSRNPFYTAGYGLPNCTCYAWGRRYEITGKRPTLSLGNAETWYGYKDGYPRGNSPALGAVICFADGPYSGLGHVAVVEKIDSDTGIVTFSNSAYRGSYFYTVSGTRANNYGYSAGYKFQGFIYLDDEPIPPPDPDPPGGGGGYDSEPMKFMFYLKKRL